MKKKECRLFYGKKRIGVGIAKKFQNFGIFQKENAKIDNVLVCLWPSAQSQMVPTEDVNLYTWFTKPTFHFHKTVGHCNV